MPQRGPHAQAGREDSRRRSRSGDAGFDFLDGRSEKGILESYLRAFGQAKRFIDLEYQYVTDAIFADALAKVL